MRKKFPISLVLALCCFVKVCAQDKLNQFNPVEHAVISQIISPDARAAGMGDVGAATDPDVFSQHWNPAKYPFCISRAGVAINYTPWLRKLVNDIGLAYVSGYYRIGDYSALSASVRYFSLGEVFTSLDENAMSVKPYEMAIDVAYSRMLSEKFSIAAAIRWIHSDLRYNYEDEESKPASAFAADIAAYYNNYINIGSRECLLGIGLNISNIGSKISFYGDDRKQFIPTNLRLGASLMVPINEYNRFSIAADLNKLLVPTVPTYEQYSEIAVARGEEPSSSGYQQYCLDEYSDIGSIAGIFKSFGDAPGGFKEELQEIQWSVGAEYVYNDRFTLRAGYHHESESKGNRKYFTVGGGFRMSAFSIDVGYVIATEKSNPLDQTLRFSLGFDIDGIKDLFRRK